MEECGEYIEYRMRNAGWEGESLFSDGAKTEIFQFTKGIPRKINTFMDRVLLFGFLENLSGITSEHIAKVMTEVSKEMFTPEEIATHAETTPPVSTINTSCGTVVSESAQDTQDSSLAPLITQENFLDSKMLTDKPLTSEERKALLEQEVDYYKTMLNELVDALDDAITHKVKLTQYIDKLLKKKYKTYVRLKEDE
jgi:hypothetical protein